MLTSLKFRGGNTRHHRTGVDLKSGFFLYGGDHENFQEWKFRTMSNYNTLVEAKEDKDLISLGNKMLSSLEQNAYAWAKELLDIKETDGTLKHRLQDKDFVKHLVDYIEKKILG